MEAERKRSKLLQLVLGPTMVYSCAYFAGPDDTLEEAQERKLDLICRKLRLADPGLTKPLSA